MMNSGESIIVVKLEKMPVAVRAEFQRISPEVKPKANDPDFMSDDEHGDQRRSQ